MILVTLGTQDKEFVRLLNAVEKAILEKEITDDVIVQAGFTNFKSQNMKVFDYIDIDLFNKYVDEASLIITHGGVGTIMNALSKGKKIIGAARLAKYGEHHNDHQIEILENFDENGYLIYAKELDDFGKYIKNIKTFTPKQYKSNTENMINLIRNYINK
ncbi:MAG: hypothetical protein MR601_01230 [Erysipelotrichaceae bacterium]|nr:hypothetical protein [Erysipelotrichaceae bacterium]